MSYKSLASKLFPFETFNSTAFIGDDNVPQKVCDLVLSLALAYNDFRAIIFARELIKEIDVNLQGPRTEQLGLRNGLENTIVRVQTGFIHELLNILDKNQETINDLAFQKILRQISKVGKQAWAALYDVATNKKSNDPLAKALLIIRHKVAFHYDAEQLGRGYKAAFFDTSRYGEPLISRGSALLETLFYFADASSQEYILSKAKFDQVSKFLRCGGELLHSINQALFEVVTCFIQIRSPWRKPKTNV